MPKQTQLTLLKRIAEDVAEIKKYLSPAVQATNSVIHDGSDGLITIIDDGKKTTSQLLKDIGCPYYSYLNDEELDKQFPPAKTVRRFKFIQEADEEMKNLSANDCADNGVSGITLRERLIMEKMWFEKKGTHLDIENVTLCAGSRYSDGLVPCVDWSGGRLCVDWYDPDSAYDCLRARSAVNP